MWYHTYSHSGEILNELTDDLVAHAALRPAARQMQVIAPSTWARDYSPEAIKLLYPLVLPARLEDLYPAVTPCGTAISASPPGRTKWALPAATIGGVIDDIPHVDGHAGSWKPVEVRFITYNPGTAKGEGTSVS